MPQIARFLAMPAALAPIVAVFLAVTPAPAQEGAATPAAPQSVAPQGAGDASSLDALLQEFEAAAPKPPGGVQVDGWIESGDSGKEVVVVVAPQGKVKLVADPGITVTPVPRPGIDWRLPTPHRMVDKERDYFDPPAVVRLPFTSTDDHPLQLRVEYAYCLVDYQCFFGEEELTVAAAAP